MAKLTNNYQTIKKLSEGTFDKGASMQELQSLQAFEHNVQELELEFPAIDFRSELSEDNQIVFIADLGTAQLPMSTKACSDVFSKSQSPATFTDFQKLGSVRHPESEMTVGEILFENAKMSPKAPSYKAIVYEGGIKSILTSRYPTPVSTGLKTSSMVEATLDRLEAMGRDTLFECKFDDQTGSTHAKIIYDFSELDALGEFGHGLEFRDNHFGSGKFFMGAYNLRLACMNGMSARDDIAGISAIHSSVQNIVKPIYAMMNMVFAFSTKIEEIAVMGRLKAIVENHQKAFNKIDVVIDPDYEPVFYDMFAQATIQYADHRRELETRTIRSACEQSIDDVVKELDKLVSKKKITKADSLTLQHLWEEDDTLPGELKDTAYGLSHVVTRYANNFQAGNIDKYSELQTLGRNLLEAVPTANFDRRRSEYNTW